MPRDPIIGNQLRFSKIRAATQARRALSKSPKPMQHPVGISLSYGAMLNRIVKKWRDLYLEIVDTQLDRLASDAYIQRPENSAGVKTDEWPDDLSLMMDQLAVNMQDTLKPVNTMALNIGQKTSAWNDNQWRKTMISVVGVDLFTQEPWLTGQVKSFANQNTQLITKLAESTRADIEQKITNGFQQGKRVNSIRKDILSNKKVGPGVFKKSSTRAKLIARDQTAKLNGQLTQLRQQEIGIQRYIWRTSFDERVRASHRIMDGKLCRWDDATVYSDDGGKTWKQRSSINGINQHPGQDFQCRCTAEAMFEDIYTKEELEGKTKAPVKAPGKPAPVISKVVKTNATKKVFKYVDGPLTDAQIAKAGVPNALVKREYTVYRGRKSAFKEFEEEQKKKIDALPDRQKQSITNYTVDSTFINNNTRFGDILPAFAKDDTRNIRSALLKDSSKLGEDIVVFRGVDGWEGMPDWEKLKGKIYTESGMVSTSPILPFDKEVQFILKVPKEKKALYISSISEFGQQEELLMIDKTKMFITDVKRSEGAVEIFGTILPD